MSSQAVDLYYREFGDPKAPPMLLLHGLFGSSANWVGIAHRLESDYHIIIPDLRNHGRSPHAESMSYELMVLDLLRLMRRLELPQVHVIGHSMGGKAAMWLALNHPEYIEKLVVADIAPVNYGHRFEAIFSGLQGVALTQLSGREDADRQLSQWVGSLGVRQYLLQNLVKHSAGWSWRFNLAVLCKAMDTLAAFPKGITRSFPGDVLFLYGGNSDYVEADSQPEIRACFPYARLRMLAGSGHWVYAEQPEAFVQAVKAFL